MSWWQLLFLLALAYVLGFFTASLMCVARENERIEREIDELQPGLNDE